jgi:hypothetical protein
MSQGEKAMPWGEQKCLGAEKTTGRQAMPWAMPWSQTDHRGSSMHSKQQSRNPKPRKVRMSHAQQYITQPTLNITISTKLNTPNLEISTPTRCMPMRRVQVCFLCSMQVVHLAGTQFLALGKSAKYLILRHAAIPWIVLCCSPSLSRKHSHRRPGQHTFCSESMGAGHGVTDRGGQRTNEHAPSPCILGAVLRAMLLPLDTARGRECGGSVASPGSCFCLSGISEAKYSMGAPHPGGTPNTQKHGHNHDTPRPCAELNKSPTPQVAFAGCL